MDFNVDVGEGFNNEKDIFPFVSSCNVACAAHAGSPEDITNVINLARMQNVAIGAHPGYPDRANFGRKSISLDAQSFKDTIHQQLELIYNIAVKQDTTIKHIKPHGALYHDLSTDLHLSKLFISVVQQFDKNVIVVGPPFSKIEIACAKKINYAYEAFADRTYLNGHQLSPRRHQEAVISDIDKVIKQTEGIILHQKVIALDQQEYQINANTICFHGDHDGAAERIKTIANAMVEKGIKIEAL